MKDLKILVLEDEQRAGEKLLDLIDEMAGDALTDWKRSVAEGIDYLKTHQPDLIFSDIELLDGSSFEIYDRIKPRCPIIFCTAYDKFYLEAFNTNGIAYLLKPYTREQVMEAWQKYQLLFEQNIAPEPAISPALLREFKTLINREQQYKRTFTVKKRDGVFLLKVDEIAYFQAQGDFVVGIDRLGKKHILNYSLSAIEEAIDPKQFFRINRSEIVNIDSILKYDAYTKNRLVITLGRPAVNLYTTNSRTPEFRSWVENQ
ncbi:MAG: response regulator transcription factor [Roseivirga sp.]|nr:response regulator transcription factor [Roseivirga sp.]